MKQFTFYKFFLISVPILFFNCLFSTPMNNRFDPVPYHTVFGTNKYYKSKTGWQVNLNLSPFYQHASGSRNSSGRKVPEGDMLGRWNMLALFYGENAAPTSKKLEFNEDGSPKNTNYPYLSRARRILDGALESQPDTEFIQWQTGKPDIINPAIEGISDKARTVAPQSRDYDIDKDYTLTSTFPASAMFTPGSDDTTGMFSVPFKYEKMGLRGQVSLDFRYGGMNIKTGFVDYKAVPTFNDKTTDPTVSNPKAQKAMDYIREYLMSEESRKQIASELDLDIGEYRRTAFEDTHIEVYLNVPFDLNNEDDEHVVTFAPYLAIGVWAPTGKKIDQNKAFSLPTGNDGFVGLTLDTALNFDFPGMVQASFGAGAVFYESKDIEGYRVPSSKYQNGIIPWKTKVSRRPGALWYANASLKAPDFLDKLSFYFDYVFTQHEKDKVRVIENTTQERLDAFYPKKLEDDSKWRSNVISGGLNYQVTPGLGLGMSFQAHLSGVRVYRTVTIMGTVSLIF